MQLKYFQELRELAGGITASTCHLPCQTTQIRSRQQLFCPLCAILCLYANIECKFSPGNWLLCTTLLHLTTLSTWFPTEWSGYPTQISAGRKRLSPSSSSSWYEVWSYKVEILSIPWLREAVWDCGLGLVWPRWWSLPLTLLSISSVVREIMNDSILINKHLKL